MSVSYLVFGRKSAAGVLLALWLGLVISADPAHADLATLHLRNVVLSESAENFIQIAGNTMAPQMYDRIVVSGYFVADGDLTVDLVGPDCTPFNAYQPVENDVFRVLSIPTNTSGSFNNLNLPALSSGLVWDTSALLDPNAAMPGSLRVAAVPEASSYLMIGVFGLLLGTRRLFLFVRSRRTH